MTSAVIIFAMGLLVMAITLTGVVLVGLSEAADPAHARLDDLTALEKELVNRQDDA